MATTVTERVTLPPIQCKPWCWIQDGHPDERFSDDQRCETGTLTVDLSTEQYSDFHGLVEHPDRLEVHAQTRPGEPVVLVVGLTDTLPFYVTPDETRQLIENLQLILGQIEAGQRAAATDHIADAGKMSRGDA